MKQTKEDRAEAYRKDMCILDGDQVRFDSIDIGSARYVAFIAGAEWQLQQSTWVSVKDGLPHSDKMVLCQMKSNNAIVSGYITRCLGDKPQVLTAPDFEFDDLMDYEPIAWMPIPDCEEG